MARPNPKMGIADLAWSPSGRWLAVYNRENFLSPEWTSPCVAADQIPFVRQLPFPAHPSPLAIRPAASLPTQVFLFSFLTAPASSFHPRLHTVILLTNAFRSFAWQPEAARAAEMVVVVSGTKGFAMWREPDDGVDAKVEGVGIPSRE